MKNYTILQSSFLEIRQLFEKKKIVFVKVSWNIPWESKPVLCVSDLYSETMGPILWSRH